MSRRGIVRLVIGSAEVDDLQVDRRRGITVNEVSARVTGMQRDHRALRWLYHRFPLSFREVEEPWCSAA